MQPIKVMGLVPLGTALESLWPQKGPSEVDEEGDGDDASEEVFDKHHGS
ncbi:MAG: hypothetical protein WAO08_15415 [Hyphomicrobiaceae bacterium]